jgi:hypothetical protein
MMSTTCVSCYYEVKNKHGDKYNEWFNNTLAINCPYVFFTTQNNIDKIKSFRKELPTYFIECDIEDFYTYKYKDKIITHPTHCPSVELNLIWNEKIFMMQKAHEINPFNSEWFFWVDAGICVYRDVKPPSSIFPNIDIIKELPKDKFIYSSSNSYEPNLVTKTNYYHHISGTSYAIHISFIPNFVQLYIQYLDDLMDTNNIFTDQVILTHIYKDNSDLFYKLCDGYGEIFKYLY